MARFLAVLAALAPALAAPLQKGTKAYEMIMCDACRIVMERLSKDVKYLTETRKVWPDSVLDERLAIACSDPSHPSGTGVEGCTMFVQDHSRLIKQEVNSRWDEDSEEFEEDIVAAEFCADKARICDVTAKGIGHMIDEASRKEKHLKEEREEKERLANKVK
ncbi:unnamed protein product [Effrenium voratum]|nr:unnamed protein product [Effrenium voratum]